MFTVIIPTLFQVEEEFFAQVISEYTVTECITEIILIDNTDDKISHTKTYLNHPKIKVIDNQPNLYVNAAWNYGAKIAKNQYLIFINDDIACPHYLFDKLIPYIQNPEIGLITYTTLNCIFDNSLLDQIINRHTIKTIEQYVEAVQKFKSHDDIIITNFKRKGMFMAMRKDVYKPIPDDLIIWAGDDYLYMKIQEQNLVAIQIHPHFIYHYDGGSKTCDIYYNPEIRKQCLQDEQLFITKYKRR